MFSKESGSLGWINASDINTKTTNDSAVKLGGGEHTIKKNTVADENLSDVTGTEFFTDDVISSLFIHVNWCSSTSFVALWRSLSPDSNTFGMNRNTVCESDLISVRPPCLSGIWSQTHPAERLKPEEWRLIGQRFDKHCLRMTITYGVMFGCLCGSYSLMEQHFTIGVLLVWCRSTMKSQGGHCTYLNPSSGNHGYSLSWQIVLEIFSCTKVLEQLNSEDSGCEFLCAAGIQSRAFIRLELALSVCYRACLASPNRSCFVCRWC